MRSVCVFCGSSSGAREEYRSQARALVLEMARRELRLIYGGANRGLMAVLADTMLAAGGDVIGVMPKALVEREVAHTGLTELRVVSTMHQRKTVMASLSDGFIALPGGFGTLDEFFELVTWSQLGLHDKPCGLLNVAGYFDRLLGFLYHAAAEGFVAAEYLEQLVVEEDGGRMLDRMISDR